MKKILVLCPYPENCAPSQRLKFEQYYGHFRENGYQIVVRPFVSETFWKIIYKPGNIHLKIWFTFLGYIKRTKVLFQVRKYDVVYTHLWVTPLGIPIFEHLLCALTKKTIYDIDDLVYLKENKSKSNGFISILKGRKKPIVLMRKSAHVITCTPYLDEFVRKYNQNTTDISSTINTEDYIPSKIVQNNLPIIGWSGSHSTSKYVYLLETVLRKVNEIIPFELKIIGDSKFKIDGLNINAIDWKETNEVAELNTFDIGIYPLPNEEWVLGKSGLKALQYMALEIPTVATAIGANYRVIEDQVSGFLVSTEDEWIDTLISLLQDENKRKSIGLMGRKQVEQKYSILANQSTYLDILNTVVRK